MSQNTIIGLLLAIVLFFGCYVVYDIKNTNKKNNYNKINLNDNLSNSNKTKEKKVIPEPIVDDKKQIVADDYKDAIKKSEERGVPVLVFFEADWCNWCKKMKKEVLTNKKVKTSMKNYILVVVDYDKNKLIGRKFNMKSLPSYIITNLEEKVLKSGNGYLDADKFTKWLNNPSLYKQPKKENKITPPKNDSERRWNRFSR